MFYYLKGIVQAVEPYLAVLDCNGVGFACNTTANTLAALELGKEAKLFTYCYIREDSFDIYGFATKSEKRCFEMLIGVSGVGPKAALSILSASTPERLAMAILTGDEKALTVAQGIGKKIAQRVILELKDKMGKEMQGADLGGGAPAPVLQQGSKQSDAMAALTVLGYSTGEAAEALRGLDMDSLPLEEIIRQALKRMVK